MTDGSVPQQVATNPMALSPSRWLLAGLNPPDLLATRDGGTWATLAPAGLPDGWWALDGGAVDSTHAWLEIASTDSSLDPGILMLTGDAGQTWRPADFGVAAAVPSPSASTPSPAASRAAPVASPPPAGSASPSSPGALEVQPLPDGPKGATQVVRWTGGWLALTNTGGSPGWVSPDGRA